MKTITITLDRDTAVRMLEDLREIDRHFDLDAFFENTPDTVESLIETFDQALMSDGSGTPGVPGPEAFDGAAYEKAIRASEDLLSADAHAHSEMTHRDPNTTDLPSEWTANPETVPAFVRRAWGKFRSTFTEKG